MPVPFKVHICEFILLWSHGLMGYNLLLSFILMLSYPLFGQWELSQAGFYVDTPPLIFEHFLVFWEAHVAPRSSYTFPALALKLAISPRSPDSF